MGVAAGPVKHRPAMSDGLVDSCHHEHGGSGLRLEKKFPDVNPQWLCRLVYLCADEPESGIRATVVVGPRSPDR